jgi:hypothetical protein
MFAPSPAPEHRSPFRDVVVVSLALGVVALGVIVGRQRLEIRRLAQAKMAELEAPSVTLRQARTRALGVRPVRKEAPARDEFRASEEAMLLNAGEVMRGFKARPQPANALARLMENPEFYQALERHRQAALDARFAGLFRRLALGPEELAQFKRLLAEKDNVALEVLAVAETQAEPMPETTVNASVDAARAKVEDQIRASLGNDRYAVYREYEQTQPQRAVVAQLEQRLSYSGAPLTPPQAEALVRILTAHAPTPPAEPGASAVVVGAGAPNAVARLQTETLASRVSDAAYDEAQTVLTPPQQAALKEIQAEQQASLLALQLIRDSIPVGERRTSDTLRLLLQ